MRSLTSQIVMSLPGQQPFDLSLRAFMSESVNIDETEENQALVQIQVSDEKSGDTDEKSGDTDRRLPGTVILVIDESGSMASAAVMHDDSDGASGLSQMDVVKHASTTVIETLGEIDRLAVVAFSDTARVVLPLTEMTKENKKRATLAVNGLQPRTSTNLHDGLVTALDMIREDHNPSGGPTNASIMLLTDGMPNVSPPRGELASLQRYLESHSDNLGKTRISTFGFGYSLKSRLLQDIAKEGRSHFSFIPDSSFVGTVFVHATANLLATALPDSTLQLEAAEGVELLRCRSGHEFTKTSWGLSIKLPSLLYGQKLDVLVDLAGSNRKSGEEFSPFRATMSINDATDDALEAEVKPAQTGSSLDHQIRCAMIRSELVQLIRTAESHCAGDYNRAFGDAEGMLNQAKARIAHICYDDAAADTSDIDAIRADIDGQISEAYGRAEWHQKWGRHYLLSLERAHTLQQCTNFKDPGLQSYATKKFSSYRDAAEAVFVKLPPPRPSRQVRREVHSMRHYYRASAPCFAAGTVEMADGSHVPISEIRAGDVVFTSTGPARVRCMVETKCHNGVEPLVELGGGVLVTPWHPIRDTGTAGWTFPCQLGTVKLLPCDRVYSFVLDGGVSMRIGKYDGIALGHGIKNDPVLKHDFLGTGNVIRDLSGMPGWSHGHVKLEPYPLIRDPETKLVVKLRKPDPQNVGDVASATTTSISQRGVIAL